MNLILIARKEDLLQKIATDLRNQHGIQVEIIVADFGKGSSIYPAIESGISGKDIGILVNNVGVLFGFDYFHKESEANIWNMVNVNIASMAAMCRIVLPKMAAKKKGAVINISSVASIGPQPFMALYSASKAYVDFLSRGLASEYSDYGITVQCIYPGPVQTDMLATLDSDFAKVSNPIIPTPQDFAANAIRTLGFKHGTCGWWSHSLLAIMGAYSHTGMAKWNAKRFMKKQKKE